MTIFQKCYDYKEAEKVRILGLYPYFRPISSEQETEVELNGKKVIMMGSNSYLGLTNHTRVKAAAQEAVEKYGTGCAGSRFLNGTLQIHLDLEEKLSNFINKEAVLLFTTGFQVNLGTIAALVDRHDYVITDKLDHASIVDAARLAFGKTVKFQHNNMSDLEKRLQLLPEEAGKLIVVDGVFSMEGDIADLPNIVKLGKEYNAQIMVDDAHSLGVLGDHGRGTASHFGLEDDVDLIMGTFSKSLAAIGGFIAGERLVIEYLKHNSRALIFSASPAPAVVGAVSAALDIMMEEPERQEKLWANTRTMRDGLQAMGYDTGHSETPILPIFIGDMMMVFKMTRRLEEEGVFINPVVPPAVEPDDSLIRVSFMATHTEAQLEFALDKFKKVGIELGLL